MTEPSEDLYIIETGKPFSQSFLWQVHRQYYEEQGVAAWSQEHVPFNITTNPGIAFAYSRLILGFIRDNYASFDLSEPLCILEIGAGSGRLGFNILRELADLRLTERFSGFTWRYILSDMSKKNVAFWQTHPRLRAFVDSGHLDFARFDIGRDDTLHLIESDIRYEKAALKNPLVVIGNYIFDSVPMDLFFVSDEGLFEVRGTVSSTQPEPDLTDPQIISRVQVDYERFPTTSDHYQDPDIARILEVYTQSGLEGIFTFPYLALKSFQALLKFADKRMVLISADKGDHALGEVIAEDVPLLAVHDGAFSMQVNYHAVVELFVQYQGTALSTPFRYRYLNILTCVCGINTLYELKQAFDDHIVRLNPDDQNTLLNEFALTNTHTLTSLLALVRYRHYDSGVFVTLYKQFIEKLKDANPVGVENLRLMAYALWATYYHMNEKYNLPLFLGTLLHQVNLYTDALKFYGYASELYGASAEVRYKMAVCLANIGAYDHALELLDVLAIELPENTHIVEIKERIVWMRVQS